MAKIVAVLVAISVLSLPVPALAAEPGIGTIEGKIVNGTAADSAVTGLEVTLNSFLDSEEIDSASSVTDSEGRFSFPGLSIDPGYRYEVSLIYQEARYSSDSISLSENQTSQAVNLTVYDSTIDDAEIFITTAHTIIYLGENGIEVSEYYLFNNESNLTYIGPEATEGGPRHTLRFTLPAGVASFQPAMGLLIDNLTPTDEGFADNAAVEPGMKEISFSYGVGTDLDNYVFPLKLNYPVANYDLVVQGIKLVNADQLVEKDPIVIENVQYSHFSGKNLPANTVLSIGLSNASGGVNQGGIIWVLAALILFGAVFSFVYLIKKRNFQPVTLEDSPEQLRERLLVQLAQLDDDFENGKIAEDEYKQSRAEWKVQLVELMQKDGKGSR